MKFPLRWRTNTEAEIAALKAAHATALEALQGDIHAAASRARDEERQRWLNKTTETVPQAIEAQPVTSSAVDVLVDRIVGGVAVAPIGKAVTCVKHRITYHSAKACPACAKEAA